MHGPKVDPKGQPLAIIKHRASEKSVDLVKKILSCFGSRQVELTAEEHDTITADTQAVTHAAFLSMGTAWKANNQFPWVVPRYTGGIENVKANLMLRIYSNKWHVYAGLAILNPSAKLQITQYAASTTALFRLMIGGQREELEARIREAGQAVFGGRVQSDLLLKDEILDRFSLGKKPLQRVPNNHLSLLAMVDCWWKLGIVPYRHLICSTPVSHAIYFESMNCIMIYDSRVFFQDCRFVVFSGIDDTYQSHQGSQPVNSCQLCSSICMHHVHQYRDLDHSHGSYRSYEFCKSYRIHESSACLDSVISINPENSIKSINFLNHIPPMKSLTILTNPPSLPPSTALPPLARRHRIPLPHTGSPPRSNQHLDQRSHLPGRRSRIHHRCARMGRMR